MGRGPSTTETTLQEQLQLRDKLAEQFRRVDAAIDHAKRNHLERWDTQYASSGITAVDKLDAYTRGLETSIREVSGKNIKTTIKTPVWVIAAVAAVLSSALTFAGVRLTAGNTPQRVHANKPIIPEEATKEDVVAHNRHAERLRQLQEEQRAKFLQALVDERKRQNEERTSD